MTLGTHQNSWSAWLWSGRNRLSPKLQNVFDSKTGASSAHELIEAATFLLNELKRGGKYSAFMDETIGALHPADPLMMSAIQKIWRAGDLLSTTNYDMLLEETVSSDYVTYGRPGEILSVIAASAPIESFIFTASMTWQAAQTISLLTGNNTEISWRMRERSSFKTC